MMLNRLLPALATLLCTPCLFASEFPSPYPAPEPGVRLTPPETPEPKINGPLLFGTRPGSPVQFALCASGERPMRFEISPLPKGLKLNPETGAVTGKITKPGEYVFSVRATNRHGQATAQATLRIGDEICLTPPMGWSSWYSYSGGVSQENILKTAHLLVNTGLANYGYRYVNIDDCWQGKRGGKYHAILPNARFADMKAMCREIHALGLKAGIYSTPWMGTYAGYRGGSSPNREDDYSAMALPPDKRPQPDQLFGPCPGTEKRGAGKVGPVWLVANDARQWADWGFDYVKMDWYPIDIPNTRRIASDLKKSGRDIVLSLSNSTPFQIAEPISRIGNLWRTTGDIADNWQSINQIASAQEPWQPYTRAGHWNDPDMLQIGRLGHPGSDNTTFTPTHLTPDEQYFQMSFWAMMSAPLITSCDLESLDDFTRGILCNREVIAINQDFQGPARKIQSKEDCEVWLKPLSGKKMAVGFFNRNKEKKTVSVPLHDLGLGAGVEIRDAWRQQEAGSARENISVELNPHGAALLVLTPAS